MNRKSFRFLMALLMCVSLLVCVCAFANADFGDFGGDADYGGGDDGGDYGGGWDDDGDYYSRSSGGSGEDDLLGLVIAVVLIGGITVVSMIRQKHHPVQSDTRKTDLNALMPMARYRELDPGFSEAELIAKVSNLYVQMQQCWTARDISSLRPYFTDAFFAQMDRQLDSHRKNNRTNHIDRIAVLSVRLLGFRQQANMDEIVMELQARIVDYTLSDATGELLSGSKTAEKLMTYEYTLIRPSGEVTVPEVQCTVTNCPNCGAAININRTAKCPYCDSIITVDNHSFVISSIRGISQKTL